MHNKIPIFLLDLVVFPKSYYSLHIFEDRYKKMLQKCLDDEIGFGILTKIRSEISKVGSYVRVDNILKHYDSGETDIVVKGIGRFVINDFNMHPDGYYEAGVEEYKDFNTEVDSLFMSEVRTKFEKVLDKANMEPGDSFWKNLEDTKLKSFKIAEKSGLNLEQQQALINLTDEKARMAFLLRHLENIEEQLLEKFSVKDLILHDGYLN